MIDPNDPRWMPVHLRRDLLKNGFDEATLRKAVRDGVFARARPGAFVDAQQWARVGDAVAHAVRARAAFHQARTPVVVSHTSSISLVADVPTWRLDLSDVHITRRDGKAGRHDAGVRQHRGAILETDVITIGDVEAMALPRALLEVTTIARVEPSLVLANHLLHHKLVRREELMQRYTQGMERWPHSLTTDIVLRLADAQIESVGETRFDYLCFRHALPRPVPQYEIFDEHGLFVARLDFAWPEHKVWVEFDGKVKYQEMLREGESPTDVVVREKKRQERVEELTGWRCIRITWDDLRDPIRLVARIRAAFAAMA